MAGAGDLVLFIALAAVVGVVGVGLGMLLAPRLGRLGDREDEEDRGGD